MATVYRVENQFEQHGLWRNFDGSPSDTFERLTYGKCRNMPMEDSPFYREGGKQWFAATDAPEKLLAWFDAQDIIELRQIGHRVYAFDVSNIRTVSEYEVVFTRDSIISIREVDPATIWDGV